MKRLLLIAVVMFAASTISAQQTSSKNLIHVYGYAEREVTPNEFTLSISIAERDSKGKISVAEQERAMIEALRHANIDVETQLRLADSASSYFKRGISLTTTNYELKLSSSDELMTAMRALDPLALSGVELTRIANSNIEEIYAEMRREAIVDARTKANELASAIDQKIGSCTAINDYNSGNNIVFRDHVSMKARAIENRFVEEAAAYDASVLEFQSSKITYSVQASFLLIP